MPKLTIDFDYSNAHVSALIEDYIHSERDRALLRRRLIDGIKFEALAEEFDLSVTRTKNIVSKGQKTIFKYI